MEARGSASYGARDGGLPPGGVLVMAWHDVQLLIPKQRWISWQPILKRQQVCRGFEAAAASDVKRDRDTSELRKSSRNHGPRTCVFVSLSCCGFAHSQSSVC